ncbi:sulfite exporter TauE/SafE family protein [Providencia sp. 21OH12SH02B-Prov]|uniref:sulfite exporter TauE/SafE family protein n=1 Tax=Providencia sp. 21OH12SH02B-Prov TaxID=3015951 RepID=UPI0022B6E919|nr:sulfite exporter TauE/SafE family protein [Providencia sp. 21OH12SH02B-Prov]WBA59021.1 sulfite exporter TauE/SafE family protein [Providencia sp. 21OH12SH02B-Prov]
MVILTELAIGALIGLIISTTGVGGGVIVLPILTYFFGLNALAAVATANFLSMLMKVSSSYMHFRLGNIPLKGAAIVLAIMLPSTFLSSLLVAWLGSFPEYQKTVEWAINLLVAAAIIFSLYLFVHRMFYAAPIQKNIAQGNPFQTMALPAVIAGIVLGATGVGGGIVVLPMLLRYMQLNIKQAIGTSIVVTTVLSGASALAYAQNEYTNLKLALTLCIGALLVMPLAKYLLIKLSERAFQYMTLLLILCSAIMMTLKAIMQA